MIGKHTRTESQREKDLILLSDLLDQGLSLTAIAREIGVSYTQVRYDRDDLEARWKEEQLKNIDDIKNRQLRKLEKVQREAWSGWKKSQEKKMKESIKNGQGISGLTFEETVTEEDRIPESRFLDVVAKCIKEENEIFGIKKVSENNLNLTQNLVNISVEMNHPDLAELIKENENSLINYEPDATE